MDASVFIHSTVFYNQEFEDILKGIIDCYYSIIATKTELLNDENYIRDIMLSKKYLKNSAFKNTHHPLEKYHFDKETAENDGRVDIRVLHIKPYKDDDAYYVIECKRIDSKNTKGKKGLNAKYIYEGIARFVSGKYSMYSKTAGMIGFVVEKMDIHQNISDIITLLNQHFGHINTEETFTHKTIVSGFKFSYFSRHKINDISKIIYHLMLDFSDNIAV